MAVFWKYLVYYNYQLWQLCYRRQASEDDLAATQKGTCKLTESFLVHSIKGRI